MRLRAKRDQVEGQIVETLRAYGWTVEHLSIPDGPDLLAGYRGVTHLIEVKTGTKKLRVGQADWHAKWRGHPVFVMRSVKDAEALALVASAQRKGLFQGKRKADAVGSH